MKRASNKQHPYQIWQITTLIFPTLYILYRLMHWEKEQFSVLGVFYLFLLAIITGGLLSLPSLALSKLACRSIAQRASRHRLASILPAVFSVTIMFMTLTVITIFLYPLHKNFWLIGISYTFSVVITTFIFGPSEKKKKDPPIVHRHQKTFLRFYLSYYLLRR